MSVDVIIYDSQNTSSWDILREANLFSVRENSDEIRITVQHLLGFVTLDLQERFCLLLVRQLVLATK